MTLLTGSTDRFVNLFSLMNDNDFPRLSPFKRIDTGEKVFETNLFGKNQYFFDAISTENNYQIFDSTHNEPILTFNVKKDTFRI